MSERELIRAREPEAIPDNPYEHSIRFAAKMRERSLTGKVVIKPSDREWFMARQGPVLPFLWADVIEDTALDEWRIFLREVKAHSGKHRHQGGLVIYVIEGEGYSVIEGQRLDWGPGDLLLLPIKPGGVEHQHFSKDPNQKCLWMAFIYRPWVKATASPMEQVENAPTFHP